MLAISCNAVTDTVLLAWRQGCRGVGFDGRFPEMWQGLAAKDSKELKDVAVR